jgi:ABC-2 type transport system ATP-binding protein
MNGESGSDAPAGLTVKNLSYSYGQKKALDSVSFSVETGRFCALLGPNGAGKTTLFSLLTRLFVIPEGQIEIAGVDIRQSPGAALSRIGVVFQQPTLDLDLSVRQNLLYFGALHGLSSAVIGSRITQGLEALDMLERADEKIRALNGGHRRRVEIARAMLHDPVVLLLDEPTVGLDVPTRRAIVNRVHALCREKKLTVLWATHLVDEVEPGDDMVVLHRGKIHAAGPVPNVLQDCGAHTVAEAFEMLASDLTTAEEQASS